MPEPVKKAIREISTLVLGRNAAKLLETSVRNWQAVISTAKNSIVVRSVVVALGNIQSNVAQMTALGVGPRAMVEGFGSKLVEVNQYLKNLDQAVKLRLQLARFRDNRLESIKIEAKLKSLDDSNKRMSIWPLIEAGEFATISEGQTEVDGAIKEGKWADYIRNITDRLPAKLGLWGPTSSGPLAG